MNRLCAGCLATNGGVCSRHLDDLINKRVAAALGEYSQPPAVSKDSPEPCDLCRLLPAVPTASPRPCDVCRFMPAVPTHSPAVLWNNPAVAAELFAPNSQQQNFEPQNRHLPPKHISEARYTRCDLIQRDNFGSYFDAENMLVRRLRINTDNKLEAQYDGAGTVKMDMHADRALVHFLEKNQAAEKLTFIMVNTRPHVMNAEREKAAWKVFFKNCNHVIFSGKMNVHHLETLIPCFDKGRKWRLDFHDIHFGVTPGQQQMSPMNKVGRLKSILAVFPPLSQLQFDTTGTDTATFVENITAFVCNNVYVDRQQS
uniref:Uncharacterized protein n=1 Tax=Panagrolaimus sp. JU765 TaxID=591449 RepID=A0AC34QYY1_9BILA